MRNNFLPFGTVNILKLILVFTKCKDNLENGRRLENISWRLWYRSTHSPVPALESNSTQMSTSFSKVLSAPFEKKSLKDNLNVLDKDLSAPITTQSASLDSDTHTSQFQSSVMPQTYSKETINRILDSDQFMSSVQDVLEQEMMEQVVNQEFIMEEESLRDITSCSGNIQREKARFFIDSSSAESIEMKRDYVGEETDYTEDDDDDGFSYSTDWSWTPSPLFSKIPLLEPKRKIEKVSNTKSQLSSALHCKDKQEISPGSEHSHLSSSMKQTLIWDRCMPFNTKYAKDRPVKEDWRREDTAEYW